MIRSGGVFRILQSMAWRSTYNSGMHPTVRAFIVNLVLFSSLFCFLKAGVAQNLPALECLDQNGRITVPASKIMRVGQGVSRPEILGWIRPEWPKDVPPFGTTILESVIDATGRVCAARVLKTPSKAVGEAAIAALRKSKFKPAKMNGKTVPVLYIITVTPHPG